MIAYPGRTFGQLYHRFVKANALVEGSFDLGDRTLRLADISAPVLVFGGATDGIAPIAAVNAVVPLLTGAEEVRFEVVPGGHLGMLTGRAARTTTWPLMDEWIDEWSAGADADPVAPSPPPRRTPSRDTIGTNPTRRYGSAGSRALGG
jgi:polyhydroxyalkanoate synthase